MIKEDVYISMSWKEKVITFYFMVKPHDIFRVFFFILKIL